MKTAIRWSLGLASLVVMVIGFSMLPNSRGTVLLAAGFAIGVVWLILALKVAKPFPNQPVPNEVQRLQLRRINFVFRLPGGVLAAIGLVAMFVTAWAGLALIAGLIWVFVGLVIAHRKGLGKFIVFGSP